jgi:hypothetical protein
MENWKVERFVEQHGAAFPTYRRLSSAECQQILERFASRLRVSEEEDQGPKILNKLSDLSKQVEDANPFAHSFSLERWRHAFGSLVLVSWDRFTHIDEIAFDDLNRCFSDIFLEGPDDIEIFDETCSTVLLIHHWGSVALTHVPPGS